MHRWVLTLVVFVTSSAAAGSFARYHPDQYYFDLAVRSYESGDYRESEQFFRSAAEYADKASQMAIAMFHAGGTLGVRDLSAAYAWSDLASERGGKLLRRQQLGQGSVLVEPRPALASRNSDRWRAIEERQERRPVLDSRSGFAATSSTPARLLLRTHSNELA